MYSSRLDLQLCTLEYTLEYLLHHCHENMMNACELLLMRARAACVLYKMPGPYSPRKGRPVKYNCLNFQHRL
jgi:hypothetical protein